MNRLCLAAASLLALFCPALVCPAQAGITVQAWGGVGAKGVDLYTLTNARGMEVKITNYGATITAIRVAGRDGKMADVVQGFDHLADYTDRGFSGRYGATIGRFANRIKDNTYQIHNITYRMTRDAYVVNEADNKPYDERVWDAEAGDSDSEEPRGDPVVARSQRQHGLSRHLARNRDLYAD